MCLINKQAFETEELNIIIRGQLLATCQGDGYTYACTLEMKYIDIRMLVEYNIIYHITENFDGYRLLKYLTENILIHGHCLLVLCPLL